MRGDVQAQRRTGGSMRYKVVSTETLRRIRTAAGLPPPFGHPPHKCGGQGDGAYLRRFPYRFCVSGDCQKVRGHPGVRGFAPRNDSGGRYTPQQVERWQVSKRRSLRDAVSEDEKSPHAGAWGVTGVWIGGLFGIPRGWCFRRCGSSGRNSWRRRSPGRWRSGKGRDPSRPGGVCPPGCGRRSGN